MLTKIREHKDDIKFIILVVLIMVLIWYRIDLSINVHVHLDSPVEEEYSTQYEDV